MVSPTRYSTRSHALFSSMTRNAHTYSTSPGQRARQDAEDAAPGSQASGRVSPGSSKPCPRRPPTRGTPASTSCWRTDRASRSMTGFSRWIRLPFNLARYVFLDPHAKDFFGQWERVADDITAALRIEAGRSPGDPGLRLLVGDLVTGSESFATRWARHDVRFHVSSTKRLCSSLVGEIELTGDALDLGDGLTVIAYTAVPGSRAQEQLDFLNRWAMQPSRTREPEPDNPLTTKRPALSRVLERAR